MSFDFILNNDITNNFSSLLSGYLVTIYLAFSSIIASSVIGIFLGILRHTRVPVLSWIAIAYIEFVRSIPLILFLAFVHFGLLPNILQIKTNPFYSSIVAFSVFTAAYIAEIVRGGLKSIDPGTIEASRSLGLTPIQSMVYVVLPLALSRMTPALVSQFIALIKDTSIASIITVPELLHEAELIYSRTFNHFLMLGFISFVYFITCYSLSLLSQRLEVGAKMRQLNKETIINET